MFLVHCCTHELPWLAQMDSRQKRQFFVTKFEFWNSNWFFVNLQNITHFFNKNFLGFAELPRSLAKWDWSGLGQRCALTGGQEAINYPLSDIFAILSRCYGGTSWSILSSMLRWDIFKILSSMQRIDTLKMLSSLRRTIWRYCQTITIGTIVLWGI